jgi:hypothetical protein
MPLVTSVREWYTRSDTLCYNDEYLYYNGNPNPYVTVFRNQIESWRRDNKVITSTSTKPWPTGKPTIWTAYNKAVEKTTANSGYAHVVWQPGTLWPAVYLRVRTNNGTYSNAFPTDTWRLPDPSIDRAVLDNKLLNKLNDEFNAAVALAEVKKSVAGVAERLFIIAKAARAVKRGDLAEARKVFGYPPRKKLTRWQRTGVSSLPASPAEKRASKDWLELQYGWMPLMKDIQAAIDTIKNKTPRYFVEASVFKEFSGSSVGSWKNSNVDGVLCRETQKSQWKMKGKYKFEYSPDNDWIRRLSETGCMNPALVVWELIPFSFVVDWFLPIGDFISAMTATYGVQFRGGIYIETVDRVWSRFAEVKPNDPARDTVSGIGEYKRSDYYKRRFVETSFPSVKLPRLKNPISTTHCANALALLVTSFRR